MYQASGSGKYTKPSDAGKKSKPGQKRQSNLPEADLFSPLHVQDEKQDDRPESKSRQDDGPALKAPLTPLKLTKATKKSWTATKSKKPSNQSSEIDIFNPHRIHSKLYTLVHKKDKSGYPASVKRCEECKVVFTSSDVIVVKTTAMREFTDPTGKQQRHSGNVYLYYLTNCLKGHNQKFQFSAIIVPDKTKVHLTDDQVAKLANIGCKFESL